jgi:hypothetical protein
MEGTIEQGDSVRHRTKTINGGLVMSVMNVNDKEALCSHFVGEEAVDKQTWFPFGDLELVHKADGSFFE